ncbi:integrase arm-type DNA-binding domain-containing protein [Paraburkholderia tropica]|uniref:integrase arm-type DNA-binding domain-containing protein n=1 Tax=Paraburkholderia tropica TaxID=92647 RepID=UPI0015902C71|nr:integrase arm-type DNA-binding domain-containing protein [Paraburkholderia tropica]
MTERKRGAKIYSNDEIYRWLNDPKEPVRLLDKAGLEFERRILTDGRSTARMSIYYDSPNTDRKGRRYSCGTFPTDSIEGAHLQIDRMDALLAQGIDPNDERDGNRPRVGDGMGPEGKKGRRSGE